MDTVVNMGRILVQYHTPSIDQPNAILGGLWLPPPPLIFYGTQKTTNATLDQQLMDMDTVLDNLRTQLALAQERMKKYVDRKRTDCEFAEGDWVFLKIRLYRQATIAKKSEKLGPKYFGPYQIEGRIGKVAYRFKLPYKSLSTLFFTSLY